MEVYRDDALCGPLCQHPSCWTSARRKSRNIPHRVEPLKKTKVKQTTVNSARSLPDDLDEYDLPKQSVVNMLDDFGDDPNDRYPSKFKGRPMHERSKSIMSALEIQQSYNRAHTRESFHKGRAPQATPASLHPTVKVQPPKKNPSMGRVEVQEVFDFDELNKDWNDTFMGKHYYVWVPNPNKKRKPHPPAEPIHNAHRSYRGNVPPKDITEDLVPQEIEWIREATVQRRYQGRSAHSPSPYSRMQAYPVSEQMTPGRDREPYYGIYELLDLPRDVLTQVLQHINERDLLDRQRFTQALMEALPQLEQKSTAIALAKSEVLQQRPMEILDGRLKEASRQNEFPSSQVFKLDGSQPAGISTSTMTTAQRDRVPGPPPPPPAEQEYDPDQITPRRLTKLRPVPPIGDKSLEEVHDSKTKIPTISLGLPTIPSGVQHTKPFKYKGVDFDFSLGPVPPYEAKVIEGPVTTPETQEDKESTQRSDKESTLHVTVPSVPSTEEETELIYSRICTCLENSKDSKTEEKSLVTEESNAVTTTTPYTQPAAPMNTPLHTPATFYDAQSESPSPTKVGVRSAREMSFPSPHPHPPVNTPAGPPVTEFTLTDLQPSSSTLVPIREADQTEVPVTEDQGPPPRSGKSVRFAPDLVEATPSVPPSTPEPAEKQQQAAVDLSEVTTVKTVEGSMSVQANTNTGPQNEQPVTGAVSSRSRRSEEVSAPPSRGFSKQSSLLSYSPEPWPQINESEYDISPSPPPKSLQAPPTPHNEDQSMAVNLDSQETTPVASTLPPKSRESNRSVLKSRESMTGYSLYVYGQPQPMLLTECSECHANGSGRAVDASPAPPPPSPEPKEQGLAKGNTGLSQLEDILETESELTISARPPSNLDDESAVPTPIISAKVTRKPGAKQPQHLSKLGKDRSGDSLRRAMAASGLVKENTTTTIPSDSVTLASDGNSDKAAITPSTGLLHDPQSPGATFPPSMDPLLAVSQANSTPISSDLFVTGTKMDVAGKSGRGLNMSRPDETRKRPVVETNIAGTQEVVTQENNKTGEDMSARNEEQAPQYVQRGDEDTFDKTEKEFQDELKLVYKNLSDLHGNESEEKK